jgi:YbgC/YbaW family acyl-CoA thioester hydrolase
MEPLQKVLESKMKIRFHDCDPFNHLNNSRYLDYMMTARGDQLIDHYDFDIYKMAQQKGIGWVTAQTQISYLSPAVLMEEVIIQTQLISAKEKSLQFEACMWNHDKTVLKAVLWTKLVHFNLVKNTSQLHTAELMQFFSQVVNPVEGVSNFEERVSQLKHR